MRLVQSGYERCAADYQTRIKALNEQTQEEHYYDDRYYEYSYEYADTTEPEYIEAKAEEALENVPNQLSRRKRRQISDYPEEEAEENVKLLCCSFQKYLHCSETVVNTTCGYETAQFTKSFLDRMSGPLIQVPIHISLLFKVFMKYLVFCRDTAKLTNMVLMVAQPTKFGMNTTVLGSITATPPKIWSCLCHSLYCLYFVPDYYNFHHSHQ